MLVADRRPRLVLSAQRSHALRRGRLFWATLLFLLTAACSQAAVATPRPVTIQISGATSMAIALQELAGEFTRQHPNVLFNIGGGGSALGETRAAEGRVTLGASTLMADDDDETTEPAATEAPPLVRIPIGIDGVAVIVHSSNPVVGLTLQQVRDIYSGRILDWQEVGGEAGEILLISREDGSGTRSVFESRVMGETAVSLTAVVMPASKDVAEYAAQNPFAIGYVSSAYLPAALEAMTPSAATPSPDAAPALAIRALAVNGVPPIDAAVKSQEYPIVQPLYLVSRGEPRGWARQFVDFALSPAGQAIVDRHHVRVR